MKNRLQDFVEKYKNESLNPRYLSFRYICGIFLIACSFFVGWGIPALALLFAVKNREFILPLLTGVFSYGISWGIFLFGTFLTAKQSTHYLKILCAKILNIHIQKRVSILFMITMICIIISVLSLFFYRLTALFYFSLCICFIIQQTILVCSLVIQNNSLLLRPFKGKNIKEYFHKTNGQCIFRFDDGVDPLYTPQILDLLRSKNVKAFFCITGERALQYPNIVQKICMEGHCIVNHTLSHSYFFSLLPKKTLQAEIQTTQKVIHKITGIVPTFFASPMGHQNIFLPKILKNENLTLLGWNINSHDAFELNEKKTKKILHKIQKQSNPFIFLLHDGTYTGVSRQNTILLVEKIFLLK